MGLVIPPPSGCLKGSWPGHTLQGPSLWFPLFLSTPSPPSRVLCAWASLFPFPVDGRASYLVPFRSFGARPSPGSRMPLQTKVR